MKKLILLIAAVAIAATLAHSSGGQQSAPEGDAPVEISLWHQTAPDRLNRFQNIINEEYMAMNPHVTINYSDTRYDEIGRRLLIAFSAGTAPDTFAIMNSDFPTFYEAELVVPLKPELFGFDDYSGFVDMFLPGAIEPWFYEDKLYMLMPEATTWVLEYNKDHFDEAGIPYLSETEPATWEEIIEIAEKLTIWEGGVMTRAGYNWQGYNNHDMNHLWLPWIRSIGGDVLNESGTRATLSSPEAIRASELFFSMYTDSRVNDRGFVQSRHSDFAGGRISMTLEHVSGHLRTKREFEPEFEIGLAPNPYLRGGDRISAYSIWGWFVNANSPHQDEAMKLMAYSLSKENSARMLEIGANFIPTSGNSAVESIVRESPEFQVYLNEFEYAIPGIQHQNYYEIMDIMKRTSDRITADGMAVAAALRMANQEIDAVLADN